MGVGRGEFKWSLSWTSWFYKLNETDGNVLCRDCLAEILIQRRIDKAIKDKIEQGTLIELPCKVGDTGYKIMRVNEKRTIVEFKVTKIVIRKKTSYFVFSILTKGWREMFVPNILGKTLFFDREEAEAKLKELTDGGGQ